MSHYHMSVRALDAVIASVRHLSPTRGKRWGMGAVEESGNRTGGGGGGNGLGLCKQVNRLIHFSA